MTIVYDNDYVSQPDTLPESEEEVYSLYVTCVANNVEFGKLAKETPLRYKSFAVLGIE